MTEPKVRRLRRRDPFLGVVDPFDVVPSRPLETTGPAATIGLIVFSATFWFIGAAVTFLDMRAGLIAGAVAGWLVHRATRL